MLDDLLMAFDVALAAEFLVIVDEGDQFIEDQTALVPIGSTANNLATAFLFGSEKMTEREGGDDPGLAVLS